MKFDTIYDGLIKGTEKLALVGLGLSLIHI